MLRTIALAIILASLTGCDQKSTDKGKAALELQGYSSIKPVGNNSGVCSETEQSKQEYKARSPQGDPVKMVVCEHFIKGEVIQD
jgi:hypothetical protein